MCVNLSSFKTFKAFTPGQRRTRLLNRDNLINLKPLKSCVCGYFFGNGRNNHGRITSMHRGGGHSRLYRKINFSRSFGGGLVISLEYDPNRNPWISRLFHPDQLNHSYILGVKNLNVGNCVRNFDKERFRLGYHTLLKNVPSGFVIHNLSSNPNKKGQYLRSSGAYGILVQKTDFHARIKLRSGEHRLFPLNASATLGIVCNEDSKFVNIGKAGRNRWKGIRPRVRGVAINPVDHPHGGGEGKTSGGQPSVTPWGKPTKGQPTVHTYNSLRISFRKTPFKKK